MLNVSKLLKMASIATGALGTTWLVADWCNHCQRYHRSNRCPAQTIGATSHPYACNNQPYGCGYGCDNPYENGYNEAYRNFNCLQWFNEWECEGWDSDDEEEYVQQAEARARELRRRRNHHHAQSEARRRQQTIDNIWRINSQDDLQAILYALQNRAQNLGLQIRDGQVLRQGFNPCGGYDPYGCNEMNEIIPGPGFYGEDPYGCNEMNEIIPGPGFYGEDPYGCNEMNHQDYGCAQNHRQELDVVQQIREDIQHMATLMELYEALYALYSFVQDSGFNIIDGVGGLSIRPFGVDERFAMRSFPSEFRNIDTPLAHRISTVCQRGNVEEMELILNLIVDRARELGFAWGDKDTGFVELNR